MAVVDTRKNTKNRANGLAAESIDACIGQMARHAAKPQAMLRVALRYVGSKSEILNRAVLSALATAWIGFRFEGGAERSGKLLEIDAKFSKQPQADKFLKAVAGYMTGNDAEDRKIAGDVALLLLAKRACPEKKLSEALKELVPGKRRSTTKTRESTRRKRMVATASA